MQKIIVTAGELLAANDAFQKLLTAEMPLTAGFQVMRIIKQLGPSMESALELRNKVIMEHGKPDGKGGSVVGPEEMAKAMPDLIEVQGIECPIEFDPIALPGTVVVDVVTLVALEKFVSLERKQGAPTQ